MLLVGGLESSHVPAIRQANRGVWVFGQGGQEGLLVDAEDPSPPIPRPRLVNFQTGRAPESRARIGCPV